MTGIQILIAAGAWYALWSVTAFIAFWRDKRAARRGAWRIRERTLLGIAAAGGFPGAYVARRHLRHKTVDRAFSVRLHAVTVIHLACVLTVMWLAALR